MKRIVFLLLMITSLISCSEKTPPSAPPQDNGMSDTIAKSQPEQPAMAENSNITLAKKSGCWACHNLNKKVVGPAWNAVSERYKGKDVKAQLVEKVKKGGKGNWEEVTGGVAMPPYSPRVSDSDIETLVTYILSLSN